MIKNSIASKTPELVSEWSEKNAPLTPADISFGSNKEVWWKCKKGHEWQATPHSRCGMNKAGCPYCGRRKVLSGYNDLETEFPDIAKEWSNKNLPITPKDVSPFSNKRVLWVGECGHEWISRIADRARGHGCPYCKDHKLLKGFNDLATIHPELVEQWSDKNLPTTPEMVTVNRPGLFWWNCPDCHIEYRAWISTKVADTGCPYCTGRKLIKGINDLATTDPEIAAEWDYEKNIGVTPSDVHRSSKAYYWWVSSFGYSWQAKVSERTMDGISCRPSGSDFRRLLPQLLLLYYAKQKEMRVLINSDILAGISIEMIVPEIKLAIDMESERRTLTKEQKAKKHICESYGFDYVLLSDTKDSKEMATQILDTLKTKHVFIKTDIDDDVKCIQNIYLDLVKKAIEENEE